MVNTDKKTREKTKETVLRTHSFPSLSQMCHAAELVEFRKYPEWMQFSALYIWCHLLFINCKDTLRAATMSHIELYCQALTGVNCSESQIYQCTAILGNYVDSRWKKGLNAMKCSARFGVVSSWIAERTCYIRSVRTLVVHFVSKYKQRLQERLGLTKHSGLSTKAQVIIWFEYFK